MKKKLKKLQRYHIAMDYKSVGYAATTIRAQNGDWVKFEDVKNLCSDSESDTVPTIEDVEIDFPGFGGETSGPINKTYLDLVNRHPLAPITTKEDCNIYKSLLVNITDQVTGINMYVDMLKLIIARYQDEQCSQ